MELYRFPPEAKKKLSSRTRVIREMYFNNSSSLNEHCSVRVRVKSLITGPVNYLNIKMKEKNIIIRWVFVLADIAESTAFIH